jgi:hypothetical protein
VALTPPVVGVVETYLGDTSWDAPEILSAYTAEIAAQADVCRLPADGAYPQALVEALCRRVAHNLALRALPLGVQASISDMSVATNRVGGLDAEVARLEAPWRKVVLG